MTLFVLLPAFNEEDSIPALLPRIAELVGRVNADVRIVLVDDGSRDKTGARTRAFAAAHPEIRVDILTHVINRGLGETMRDGIEHCVAAGRAGDIIVRMDCDDSQDPSYIPALIDCLQRGNDVALTSRYQPGGGDTGLTGYRKWLSWGAGLFMKACFPMRGVRDYSSGYRAYRWEILRDAVNIYGNRFIEQKLLGFSCTLEKLVKLDMLGARIAEVAHVLHYDRKKSVSKMASRPTMLGYILLAVRYNPLLGINRRAWRQRIAAVRNESNVKYQSPQEPVACAASSAA